MPLTVAAMTASHAWASTVAYAALYGPAGGATGVDGTPVELSGTGYARRTTAVYVPTPGMLSMSAPVTFTVPAGSIVAWFGLLNATGNLLALDPISEGGVSNVPQPCLFDDLSGGTIKKPGQQQGARTYVVFWDGPSPVGSLFSSGYVTLPTNVESHGKYSIWPLREQRSTSFRVANAVGLSEAARLEPDTLVPSNRGWGYWQRMDPLTYAIAGTYTLNVVHVRTIG